MSNSSGAKAKNSNGPDIVPLLAIGLLGAGAYDTYKEYIDLVVVLLILSGLSIFLGRFLTRKRKEILPVTLFFLGSTMMLLVFLGYTVLDPSHLFLKSFILEQFYLIFLYGVIFNILCLNLAFYFDIFKDPNLYLYDLAGPKGKNRDFFSLGKAKSMARKSHININSRKVQKSLLGGHQMIFGASGAGKTFSILRPQIAHAISQYRLPIFIIDPKGDLEFRDAIYNYCKDNKIEDKFRYFSLSNPEASHKFNPFKTQSITELKDLIISATDWSEPYYKKMAEVHLLKALVDMEKPTLSKIIAKIPAKKELAGLKADLEIMKLSEFGRLIDDENAMGIKDLYDSNQICYFSLDVQAYPETAVRLGRIILGSLMGLSNHIQTTLPPSWRKPTTIVIDEFGSFVSDTFIDFLNKARSSNMRIIMATQSLGDLKKHSPEMLSQVLDSTMVKMVMRMGDPDSIDYCSHIFGTQDAIKETRQINNQSILFKNTGKGTERETQEFIVHPNKIRELNRGEGFVITQDPYSISKVKFHGCQISEKEMETYKSPQTPEGSDPTPPENFPVKKESETVRPSDFSSY